ncbi:hypothetical protein CLU79DRAFT_743048 [Phycomyces nitens]|nr:hypothetical protein CLU79DRAFT_743048 [Phycomyces nitens]
MTIPEASHRHAAKNRAAVDQFKALASNLDGWELASEKEGVKLYSKKVEGSPMPLVRGEIIFKTTEFSVRDVAAVALVPGCRKIWDERYEVSETKEWFSPFESLFWVKLKAPWPISPRDFSACCLRDMSDDECNLVIASVEDPLIPHVSGCVRGNLIVSGWKIYKVPEGVGLIYITQVDLAGSIPSSFLKTVQIQVPLCAGKVVEYIKSYGFPPILLDGTSGFQGEHFDHAKRSLVAHVEGQGEARFVASHKMYPNGVKVAISGAGTPEILPYDKNDKLVVVKGIDGPATITITKA